MRLFIITLCLASFALPAARHACAQPAPLASGLFSFPGFNSSPGSAVCAGLALAA